MIEKVQTAFINEKLSTVDGLKIDFTEGWVHMRKSNTEPIIRIYAEGKTEEKALELANRIKALF
jgi:phosphomannomutase